MEVAKSMALTSSDGTLPIRIKASGLFSASPVMTEPKALAVREPNTSIQDLALYLVKEKKGEKEVDSINMWSTTLLLLGVVTSSSPFDFFFF